MLEEGCRLLVEHLEIRFEEKSQTVSDDLIDVIRFHFVGWGDEDPATKVGDNFADLILFLAVVGTGVEDTGDETESCRNGFPGAFIEWGLPEGWDDAVVDVRPGNGIEA